MNKTRTILFLLLFAALAAALPVLQRRNSAETANSHVQLVVDLEEARSLAASLPGQSLDGVLRSLKEAGATSVAVTENTMPDLLMSGLAGLTPIETPSGRVYRVWSTVPAVQDTIRHAFTGQGVGRVLSKDGAVTTTLSPAQISAIPVGFSRQLPLVLHLKKDLGFSVVARAYNFPESNPATFTFLEQEMKSLGADRVIFAGDEVLGWRGAVDGAAAFFNRTGLLFGAIEFGKQKGSDRLQDKLKGHVLRVHSISNTEMATYQPAEAVERFVRAARERSIRVLYIHLLTTNGPDGLAQNQDYLKDIVAGLEKAGLTPGEAGLARDPQPRRWEVCLIALGVAAGAVLALGEFVALDTAGSLGWLAAFAVVLLAGSLAGDLGRKVVALASALVFPIWAMGRCARLSAGGDTARKEGFAAAAGHYVAAIIVAAIGGVFIASVLSGRMFMTQTDQFAGVKLAHVFPLFVILLAACAGTLGTPLPPAEMGRRARESFKRIWNSPLLFMHAVVGMIALVALLLVVLRSGNDAGVGVSPLELRFRAILDQILYVRPRTKEIFVGYPCLVAAIWLSSRRQKAWASFFFVAATVGMVSAVNSFCHIHSPVMLSAVRVFNGAWVGAVLGLVFIWVLKKLGLGAAEDGRQVE